MFSQYTIPTPYQIVEADGYWFSLADIDEGIKFDGLFISNATKFTVQ